MSLPMVVVTTLDNQLGVVSQSPGAPIAIVGACSAGPLNAPTSIARVEDLGTFGRGPVPQLAAHVIARYGRAVLIVRTATATAGAVGSIDTDIAGDGGVTDDSSLPNDDYDVVIEFLNAGEAGADVLKYRYSLDGGANFSPAIPEPSTSLEIEEAGIKLTLADNFAAGDSVRFTTTAPLWTGPDLADALTSLANTSREFDTVFVVGEADASAVQQVDTFAASLESAGKPCTFAMHVTAPTFDTDPATTAAGYFDELEPLSEAVTSKFIELYAGECDMPSSLDGRTYRRSAMYAAAPHEFTRSEEANPADPTLGSLPCTVTDADGNPKHHNEAVFPGLDDLRFTVLRTIPGKQGVYVNRGRLFSPAGSDFRLATYRRVFNLTFRALFGYLTDRLSRPVRVSRETGFILETEARDIEEGARAVLRAVLMTQPKASGFTFDVARDDNLLSTQTLTVSGRVIPLGYPEFINLSLGFMNPALQTQAV